MTRKSLATVTKSLGIALRELANEGVPDSTVRWKYAEFLVAKKLLDLKHPIKFLSGRKSADICLTNTNEQVEVKTCRVKCNKWAYASFGDGNQIKNGKFDYCVWVVFNEKEIPQCFVFTKKELAKVKVRRGYGGFKNNCCLLTYATSSEEFEKWMKENDFQPFEIERKLIQNPKRFLEAWDKIPHK